MKDKDCLYLLSRLNDLVRNEKRVRIYLIPGHLGDKRTEDKYKYLLKNKKELQKSISLLHPRTHVVFGTSIIAIHSPVIFVILFICEEFVVKRLRKGLYDLISAIQETKTESLFAVRTEPFFKGRFNDQHQAINFRKIYFCGFNSIKNWTLTCMICGKFDFFDVKIIDVIFDSQRQTLGKSSQCFLTMAILFDQEKLKDSTYGNDSFKMNKNMMKKLEDDHQKLKEPSTESGSEMMDKSLIKERKEDDHKKLALKENKEQFAGCDLEIKEKSKGRKEDDHKKLALKENKEQFAGCDLEIKEKSKGRKEDDHKKLALKENKEQFAGCDLETKEKSKGRKEDDHKKLALKENKEQFAGCDLKIVAKEWEKENQQKMNESCHERERGGKEIEDFQKRLKKTTSDFRFFSASNISLTTYPVSNPNVHNIMRYEILRLRSFEKAAENVPAAVLAQGGFYYSGPKGQVTCFSCQINHDGFLFAVALDTAHESNCQRAIMNIALFRGTNGLTNSDLELFDSVYDQSFLWESGSSSSGNHRSGIQVQTPDPTPVYFVLTSATKNEPLEYNPSSKAWMTSDNSSSEQVPGAVGGGQNEEPFLDLRGAAYPLFANRRTRRDTFHSWDPSHSQKPDDLVSLGFFYAGYSDCARCFYCGLGLKYWRPNDNAAYQHARFRPQCLYNSFVKGQEFIDQVQREIAAEGQGRGFDPTDGASGRADAGEVPNMDQLMRSEAVRRVLEENWTREQVREGVVKLIHDLGEECLVYDILREVMQNNFTHSQSTSEQVSETQDETDSPPESHDGQGNQLEMDAENSSIAASASPAEVSLTPELVVRLLEREHNYLKKRLHCMVCGAQKVGCIYLPCGHVVACVTCGDYASTCALCEKVISATANIYMS